MKTDNHEVIFAIVNSGFADEAMAIAREKGARGGTILNARGVARENEAAFFGITIHAEKEIRDDILNALYQRMGMDKKAQGIAFSMPVSDAAGLVKPTEPNV